MSCCWFRQLLRLDCTYRVKYSLHRETQQWARTPRVPSQRIDRVERVPSQRIDRVAW